MVKILFSDSYDSEGNVIEIVCKGHVNLNLFNLEAEKIYKDPPKKTRHTYRTFKRIEAVKVKGKVKGGYNTYVECDRNKWNAEPITKGYY